MKTPFAQNMGTLDRIIRVCLGTLLVALGIAFGHETLGVVLLIVSAVPLISGITGFCPTYTLLGISTKRETDVRGIETHAN